MKRLLCLAIALILLTGGALADVQASINQKLATRTGPGSNYDEPGTFFISKWKNQTVRVISRAQGGGVWWVQVELTENGKTYRVYTGAKRVNVDLNSVPEETVLGAGSMIAAGDVTGYYGPGPEYTAIKHAVPWSVDVTVYGAENGYLLVDFYDSGLQRQRRAWVYGELASVQWYGAQPAGSQAESTAGIADGSMFRGDGHPAWTCLVRHYGETGGYTIMDLDFGSRGKLEYLVVIMRGSDRGDYYTSDGHGGEVWFDRDQVTVEANLPGFGISEVLVFKR